MHHITLCLLGIVILSTGQVFGAEFRANASTVNIGGQNPTSALNITCSPSDLRITAIFVMEIGRTSRDGTNNPIIQIGNTDPNSVAIKNTSLQQRVSTSGSISGSTGSLMMSLRDLRCEDAGSYYCRVSINTASGSKSDDGALNISVQTTPGTIEMTVNSDQPKHHDGEEVTFSCHGTIGNREGSMESLRHWQWRDTADFNPQWTTYASSRNNITYHPKQPSGDCQYTARSELTRVVKTTDNGLQFRCYFYTETFGDNITLYLGTESTETSRFTASTTSKSDISTIDPAATDGSSLQTTESTVNSGQDVFMCTAVIMGFALMLVLAVI